MNSETHPKQTLEQRRAHHAWKTISEMKSNKKDCGNFTSYVDALPAAILMNGLGQALATELAGKDSGHKILYNALKNWLCGGDKSSPYSKEIDLIEAIIQGDQKQYIQAQPEALAYLVWLKKFSRALLETVQISTESPESEG